MTDDAAATLLHEVAELRRQTRRDRHAYWPPMLLLGVLVLAAPLVYGQAATPRAGAVFDTSTPEWRIFGTDLVFMPLRLFGPGLGSMAGDPTAIAVYWLCVVVLGVAATMAWYRWRGARVGLETSTRTFVLVGIAGLLFLFGILPLVTSALVFPYVGYASALGISLSVAAVVVFGALSVVALRGAPRPLWRNAAGWVSVVVTLLAASGLLFYASIQGYAPLLVIAVALLALAVIERSTLCGVIAVLFALAALLTNLYNMENLLFRFGNGYTDDPRLIAFAHLVLPAAVLIIGGAVAALVARRTAR